MSQGQDKFYWMPHKQDMNVLLCLAGDNTGILRNNQEQVVIPVGNMLETTHSMTIQHVTRSRLLVTFLKRVEWNDKHAIDFMFPNISSFLCTLLDSGIWSTGSDNVNFHILFLFIGAYQSLTQT